MEEVELQAIAKRYLEAFEKRDVEACLAHFSPDAVVDFQGTSFQGLESIREWHKDRFAANLRILEVESIVATDNSVIVELVAASDRLAAWKIQALNGRITVQFEGDKIVEAKLAPRMTNLFDMLRSGE